VFAIKPMFVQPTQPHRLRAMDPVYALLWSSLLLNLAATLSFSLTFAGSAQGRYLYPSIGAFAVLAARGFHALVEGRSNRVQQLSHRLLAVALILLAILFELSTVAPVYFPTS
jgi:hypothetical protein